MLDLMSRGVAWLSKTLRHCAGVPVLYERPATDGRRRARRVVVMAVLGRAEATGEASVEPVRLDAEAVDFLVATADLVFGRQMVEPRTDDRVYLERDGRTLVYEVLPPSGGNPPWRWSDPQRTIRRIHAKLTEA